MIIITAKEVAVQCIAFRSFMNQKNPTTLRMHNFSKSTLKALKYKVNYRCIWQQPAILTFSSTLKYSKVYHKVFQQSVFLKSSMCSLDPDQIYEKRVRRLKGTQNEVHNNKL